MIWYINLQLFVKSWFSYFSHINARRSQSDLFTEDQRSSLDHYWNEFNSPQVINALYQVSWDSPFLSSGKGKFPKVCTIYGHGCHHLGKFSFPLILWLQLAQGLQRRNCLKMLMTDNGQKTDNRPNILGDS